MIEPYFSTLTEDQICYVAERQKAWCDSLAPDYRAQMFKVARTAYVQISRIVLDNVAAEYTAEGWTNLEDHQADIDDIIINVATATLDGVVE